MRQIDKNNVSGKMGALSWYRGSLLGFIDAIQALTAGLRIAAVNAAELTTEFRHDPTARLKTRRHPSGWTTSVLVDDNRPYLELTPPHGSELVLNPLRDFLNSGPTKGVPRVISSSRPNQPDGTLWVELD